MDGSDWSIFAATLWMSIRKLDLWQTRARLTWSSSYLHEKFYVSSQLFLSGRAFDPYERSVLKDVSVNETDSTINFVLSRTCLPISSTNLIRDSKEKSREPTVDNVRAWQHPHIRKSSKSNSTYQHILRPLHFISFQVLFKDTKVRITINCPWIVTDIIATLFKWYFRNTFWNLTVNKDANCIASSSRRWAAALSWGVPM